MKDILCNCCRGELAEMFYRDAFLNKRLVQCRTCGHIQVSETPSKEVIAAYYAGAYGVNRNKFVGEAYLSVMKKRAQAQLQLLKRFISLNGAIVCDIGCGFGAFLAEIHKFTGKSYGLEFDQAALAHCAARGLTVHRITDETEVDFPERVDLAVLSHVVEHLREMENTLLRIKASARYLYIEVPCYRADLSVQFKDQEGHINFFTTQSLTALLQRLGFRILYLRGAGPSLTTFWSEARMHRLIRKVRRKITGDWFFDDYSRENDKGIWIRSIVEAG